MCSHLYFGSLVLDQEKKNYTLLHFNSGLVPIHTDTLFIYEPRVVNTKTDTDWYQVTRRYLTSTGDVEDRRQKFMQHVNAVIWCHKELT